MHLRRRLIAGSALLPDLKLFDLYLSYYLKSYVYFVLIELLLQLLNNITKMSAKILQSKIMKNPSIQVVIIKYV